MLEPIDGYHVNKTSLVKLTYMGNITEKLYLSRRNKNATVQRLPDNKMIILSSGEVKELKPMETRLECKNSLKKTMRNLRNLLNANIEDVKKCRWVTLTYAENMTDTKRLYEDFRKFNMKFKYHCEKSGYSKYEYIVAMEPQGRGAWHCHVVFIFDDIAPFIPNEILRDIWGHGYVTIKRLDDVDNVGAYLTAYLGDMEMNDAAAKCEDITGREVKQVEYTDEKGEKQTKYFIKGARLSMYPANFNLYRNSRGVKKPIEEYCTEEEARKKVSAGTLTFQSTHLFSNPEDGFECVIDKKYYNNKRKNTQEPDIVDNKETQPNTCINEYKAYSNMEWKPMYSERTGEIFKIPFDD